MMCLTPDQFAGFIGMLDSSIIQGMMYGVRILATDGPIDWIWLANKAYWCIDGVWTTPGVGR